MHTLTVHSNWQSHRQPQHWIKHSLVPVAFICLLLLLPKPWTNSLFQPNHVIELELLETSQEIQKPLTEPEIKQPKLEQSKIEPLPGKVIEPQVPTNQIIKPEKIKAEPPLKQVKQEKLQTIPQTTMKPNTQPQINAGDVLQMIENRTSIDITPEFQARTEPATDFYIPEQQITDWYANLPYLDESVDKPKLQMRFYAKGFEGSIERFFDKITISKTFTTKYGTKIHCALIGVLAACSWK